MNDARGVVGQALVKYMRRDQATALLEEMVVG